MSVTTFSPSIPSRPVYAVLRPMPGRAWLVVVDGPGAGAVADLLAQAPEIGARMRVIAVPGRDGVDHAGKLPVARFDRVADVAAAVALFARALEGATMGLRLATAGTEGLMGQVQRAAMAAGLPLDAVQMEHRGPTLRRVQCVHCKTVAEDVSHDPYRCPGCGLHLFVRDHYSRRIAAFQGVNIDAEDPGRVPPAVERFG